MKTPDRIYVRFAGDNDFAQTVKAFVKAIAPRIFLGAWAHISKEDIVNLFNKHAFSLYALYQCHDLHPDDSLRSYLNIEVKDVYFDEEIDEFTNFNHDGCMASLEFDDIAYYIM